MTRSLTHIERLEAESIHIMREVVAEAEKPVMLYSVGKDSAVMLHLARKAFYPAPPPFPLLHVDTTWKFKAMYELRDRMAKESGMEMLVYRNPEAEERGINPSVLKITDEKAKLPMFGTIGSLNVSVACGAFLYETVRQRAASSL